MAKSVRYYLFEIENKEVEEMVLNTKQPYKSLIYMFAQNGMNNIKKSVNPIEPGMGQVVFDSETLKASILALEKIGIREGNPRCQCPDCLQDMVLIKNEEAEKLEYRCQNPYPDCISHDVKKDGTVKGVPVNKKYRTLRSNMYQYIREVWAKTNAFKNNKITEKESRDYSYKWLSHLPSVEGKSPNLAYMAPDVLDALSLDLKHIKSSDIDKWLEEEIFNNKKEEEKKDNFDFDF